MEMFPTNVKQASSPSLVHVEQCLRTGISQSLFGFRVAVFFFASNRFFQEPVPKEDKNRNPQ